MWDFPCMQWIFLTNVFRSVCSHYSNFFIHLFSRMKKIIWYSLIILLKSLSNFLHCFLFLGWKGTAKPSSLSSIHPLWYWSYFSVITIINIIIISVLLYSEFLFIVFVICLASVGMEFILVYDISGWPRRWPFE